MFAKASSVSVTSSAKSATIAANPPATTAVGSAAGSLRSRERTRTTPRASSHASGNEVAEPRAQAAGATTRREARVVRRERDPRDRDRHDDVGSLPDREPAVAGRVPERSPDRRRRAPTTSGRGARTEPPRRRSGGRSGERSRSGRAARATSANPPKTSVHSHWARKPKSSSESAAAAVAMMSSSNTDQPMPWSTLTPVGRYEPRRPSGARISTMPGTRASAPIAPATPSMTLPITQPTRIATRASGNDSAGTSAAPATITSSETPRFPQSRPVSSVPSTRKRSGTGSTPQLPSIRSGACIDG